VTLHTHRTLPASVPSSPGRRIQRQNRPTLARVSNLQITNSELLGIFTLARTVHCTEHSTVHIWHELLPAKTWLQKKCCWKITKIRFSHTHTRKYKSSTNLQHLFTLSVTLCLQNSVANGPRLTDPSSWTQ